MAIVRTSVEVHTDTGIVPPPDVSGTRSTMTSGSRAAYASPRGERGESPPSLPARLYADSPWRVSQIFLTRATPALHTWEGGEGGRWDVGGDGWWAFGAAKPAPRSRRHRLPAHHPPSFSPCLHEEEHDLAGDVARNAVDVHVARAGHHVDELDVVQGAVGDRFIHRLVVFDARLETWGGMGVSRAETHRNMAPTQPPTSPSSPESRPAPPPCQRLHSPGCTSF